MTAKKTDWKKVAEMAATRLIPHLPAMHLRGSREETAARVAEMGRWNGPGREWINWEASFGVSISLDFSLDGNLSLSWGGKGHDLAESNSFAALLSQALAWANMASASLREWSRDYQKESS